ncbi:hypothetical protein H8D30_07010 [bacterium]|nr:hypothetical protein [bacterium]
MKRWILVVGVLLGATQGHTDCQGGWGVSPERGKGRGYVTRQDILSRRLDRSIAPETPGEVEIFYLGFAGDAKQDVFMLETLFGEELFLERFSKEGHTLSLVNNKETFRRNLVANEENLAHALDVLGQTMGQEDILFLYLTSHGSRDHYLSVDFKGWAEEDLNGEMIRSMLDEADIRWRIVVVSACFSGGFIPALEGSNTLVATASDADQTSFGCSDERDFTFYGEALFFRQLDIGVGLLEALEGMPVLIDKMEDKEGYEHSNPQMVMGEEFLVHWTESLSASTD